MFYKKMQLCFSTMCQMCTDCGQFKKMIEGYPDVSSAYYPPTERFYSPLPLIPDR